MEQRGIAKAAYGVKNLLNYIKTNDINFFIEAVSCLDEIKLWTLITLCSNNIDEFYEIIPDFVLEDIFETRQLSDLQFNTKFDYGMGCKSSSSLPYKSQFKMIRNALSHGDFVYQDGIVYLSNKDYEATIDLKWLYILFSVTLSSNKLALKKGMSDFSIMSLVPIFIADDMSIEDFKRFSLKGNIMLYKVTSLTSNKESMTENIKKVITDSKLCTFELVFSTAVHIIKSKPYNFLDSHATLMKEINKYFKEIEEIFSNKIKIELVPLDLDEDVLNDPLFQNLSYEDKLKYLVRREKSSEPGVYNYYSASSVIDLMESFVNGEVQDKDVYCLKDAYDFLIKVYSNIFFSTMHEINIDEIAKTHPIECSFVRGKDVYTKYLKILNRSLADLTQYNGSSYLKKSMLNEIKKCNVSLDLVIKDEVFDNFSWKVRNAIVHGKISFTPNSVTLFNCGRKLKVPLYSKKDKSFSFRELCSDKVIWKMTCAKDDYISFLDSLYSSVGISIERNSSLTLIN